MSVGRWVDGVKGLLTGLSAAANGYQVCTMMSAGTVAFAWSPHHGEQNHEHTDINAYCDDDPYAQRDSGDPKPARPDCLGRVKPVCFGPNTRRRPWL